MQSALRNIILSLVLIMPGTPVLEAFSLPPALLKNKKGTHILKVIPENALFAKKGVYGQLHIPPSVSEPGSAPVLVFFHGNSRNQNSFKSAGNFLHKYAAKKRFLVLSVQNWWPLSGDQVAAAEDSRRAANIMVQTMVKNGLGDKLRVFVTGFSAGGLTALSTFLNSIDHWENPDYREKFQAMMQSAIADSGKTADEYFYSVMFPGEGNFFSYAGVVSIKGNFYREFYMPDPILPPDDRKMHIAKLAKDKPVILIVGGKRDAARVQKQIPEANAFFNDELGIKSTVKQFSKEGHSPDASNIQVLLSAMGL